MKYLFILLILLALPQTIETQNRLFNADDLYHMALENSSRLREKTSREKAADYRVRELKSTGAPTFSFESSMSYMTNPETLIVETGALGNLDLTGLGGPITAMPSQDTTFEMSGNSYYDFKLILDQPVFTWGKIHNAIQAGKEGAAVATLDSMKMRELLYTEIRINCRTLHYMKEIELAAEKQSEFTARLVSIAEDNFNNGMILQTEFLDTQVKSKEAELMKNRISLQIEQVVLNLTYLAGVELTPIMIETNFLEISLPESWQEIYRSAITNNRDLSMMRHNVSTEEYKNKIQKGSYYFKPDLALHMELSYSGSYFPLIQNGWNEKNRGNLSMTVAIKSPIADFGGMYASSKAAEENLVAARASYESGSEEMEKIIRQALRDMELNQLNLDFYKEKIQTDLLIIDQKDKEWRSGYGDEKDYILRQISHYSNIILMNRELIELDTNYFRLLNIMGN